MVTFVKLTNSIRTQFYKKKSVNSNQFQQGRARRQALCRDGRRLKRVFSQFADRVGHAILAPLRLDGAAGPPQLWSDSSDASPRNRLAQERELMTSRTPGISISSAVPPSAEIASARVDRFKERVSGRPACDARTSFAALSTPQLFCTHSTGHDFPSAGGRCQGSRKAARRSLSEESSPARQPWPMPSQASLIHAQSRWGCCLSA